MIHFIKFVMKMVTLNVHCNVKYRVLYRKQTINYHCIAHMGRVKHKHF